MAPRSEAINKYRFNKSGYVAYYYIFLKEIVPLLIDQECRIDHQEVRWN